MKIVIYACEEDIEYLKNYRMTLSDFVRACKYKDNIIGGYTPFDIPIEIIIPEVNI